MRLAFLIAFSFLSLLNSFSQTPDVQASLIFGCAKYVEWPASASQDKFVIAVTGDIRVLKAIETTAATKRVKGKGVIVRWHENLNAIADCDLLYVGTGSLEQFDRAILLAREFNILVVSSIQSSEKRGAGLNFVLKNNRPAIELNRTQIEEANLKVSTQLVGLSIAVD